MNSSKLFDKILFLSMFLWMSVSSNLGSLGFVINGLIKELGMLSVNIKALIGSSSLIGMFIGALISGFIGDRLGRKKTIMLFVIIQSVSSILSYVIIDPIWFIIWRIIAGIGMGGLLPVVASLVSEYSVPRNRGKRISLLESSWAYGWLIAVGLAYLLLNGIGWLLYGILLSIISLLFSIIGLWVEESPRYLLSIGCKDEAIKLAEKYGIPLPEIRPRISMFEGLKKLFVSDYKKVTIGLWILWFTITMGYYGIFIWYPKLLVQRGTELGYQSLSLYLSKHRLDYLLITTLAQIPGYYSAAYLVDKIGRKKVLFTYMVFTGIAAFVLAGIRDVELFILAGITLSFFDLGAWAALYTYTPEQYPTNMRVMGTAWASTIGRLGGIIGPYIVPYLGSWETVFMFFALIHIIGSIGVFFGRELMGKEMIE